MAELKFQSSGKCHVNTLGHSEFVNIVSGLLQDSDGVYGESITMIFVLSISQIT